MASKTKDGTKVSAKAKASPIKGSGAKAAIAKFNTKATKAAAKTARVTTATTAAKTPVKRGPGRPRKND